MAVKKRTKAAPPRYVAVTLELPMGLSDAASTALWDQGTLGVTVEDDETRARPHDPLIPKTGRATLKATFQHKRGLQARVLAALRGVLQAARRTGVDPALHWEDVEQRDWGEEWKRHWKPMAVGKRIWIVPTWERDGYRPKRGALPLFMDPGMAFGTGTHETTQLCVTALEEIVPTGAASLLDVGTGTGVLAMAAARLAAAAGSPLRRIVGIDIDMDSVRAARENALLNALEFTVDATPVERVKGPFDIVVANILLEPLKGMKTTLARLLAPRGTLVLSGILVGQRAELERAYGEAGLRTVARATLGEWACVQLQHPAR